MSLSTCPELENPDSPLPARDVAPITSLRDSVRKTGSSLDLIYKDHHYIDPARSDEAAIWLRDNRTFVRSHLRELKETFTPRLLRALRDAGRPLYQIVAEALADYSGDWSQRSLARLFDPAHLGVSLSLAEVWAIPQIVNLILLEQLTAAVTERDDKRIVRTMQSLHAVDRLRWRDVIEAISPCDRILRKDPSGVYPAMTFESRDVYRKAVQELASESGVTEEEVANAALACAKRTWAAGHDMRTGHVGYYLVGPGIRRLERYGDFSRSMLTRAGRLLHRRAGAFYLASITLVAVALAVAFSRALHEMPAWWLGLFLIPVAQTAVTLINLGVNMMLKPAHLPRLDFSKGIPDDCRTFVVVPTLLLSRPVVARLLKNLEVHYLANRDRNLLFALLTDLPDSKSPEEEEDPLVDLCARGIHRLNQRHGSGGSGPFYLFHRRRRWNEAEDVWMGRERKRGKLEDFNRYLLNEGDAFETKAGDLSAIGEIRYVITLDSDTQLPRDTAWKLVGTMAHPMNRATLDPDTQLVRDGYAIIQPRSITSMESASQSRLARIYGGDTGLDPYATAISNLYQDLCGRASYTGKGIYDLRAFHACLDGRFPDETLLSHDLIEGEHARTGLATDIDILEDFPTSYESYSKRKHRWVRGDWQILNFLFGVSPLPFIARWKIFDNLRRSLFEVTLLIALITGVILAPASTGRLIMAAAAVLVVPAYIEFSASFTRLEKLATLPGHIRERLRDLERAHVEAFLTIAFLPHQAILTLDAIARTLVRMSLTHRRLLEWESMAQAELSGGRRIHPLTMYLIACPLLATLPAVLWNGPLPLPLFTLLAVWIGSPLLAQFVSAPSEQPAPEPSGDVDFLREISLRTWRFFEDYSTPESNWLVPDNVQQEPEHIAHQASPTNIGLQLASVAAAFDFGYVTQSELAEHTARILETIQRLECYRGHLYNWYDTQTLDILPPRYISTVDSGNLAAALITVKQALASTPKQPIVDERVLAGIRDHVLILRNALPDSMHAGVIVSCFASLLRLLDAKPTNLLYWRGTLGDISKVACELDRHLDWVCRYLEDRDCAGAPELRYWRRIFLQRIESALSELCALAPWMSSPFQEEFRARSTNEAFRDVIEIASGIPTLGELPDVYDALEGAAERLLDAPVGATFQSALRKLLRELPKARAHAAALIDGFAATARTSSQLAMDMDFGFLLDGERDLMRIGFNAATGEVDPSYYDLLASEARTAVFFAVAKGDAPRAAWFSLGRKITSFRGVRTLLSWSGSMFEYLMPSLFMKTFAPTLLNETLRGVVRIQQTYAREQGIPWGISESACSTRDAGLRYRYRAFGIPGVSLRQASGDPADHRVVAPYASVLALLVDRRTAVENLRKIANRGHAYCALGRYGLFESIDFRGARGEPEAAASRNPGAVAENPAVVRSFMAHHQAMSLLALCNTLHDNVMQKRFHSDPLVKAAERLLQERARALIVHVDNEPEQAPARPIKTPVPSFEMEY